MEYGKDGYGALGALPQAAGSASNGGLCQMQKRKMPDWPGQAAVMEGKAGMNAAVVDPTTIGQRLDKKIAEAQAVLDEYKALKRKLQEGRILELTPSELNQIMYAI